LLPAKKNRPLTWREAYSSYNLGICQIIFQIAIKYLCTPGSSVPVERLFSTTGYIITDRRNRLSPKNVKMLSFLNKNYKLVL
jgi:hypothetical protein